MSAPPMLIPKVGTVHGIAARAYVGSVEQCHHLLQAVPLSIVKDGIVARVYVSPIKQCWNFRGSGPKNMIFSNGTKIIFEWSNLLN